LKLHARHGLRDPKCSGISARVFWKAPMLRIVEGKLLLEFKAGEGPSDVSRGIVRVVNQNHLQTL
jgi:hypothetical protein